MSILKSWAYAPALIALASASAPAFAATLNVCARTAPVKVFIEQKLAKPCADVTEGDLATLTRIAVPNRDIAAFQVGDFSGLPNLEILNIVGNPFTELPEGVFAGLPKLKVLVMFDTQLRHLPDDFLEGLPLLEDLHIFSNPFKSIGESVFRRLEASAYLKNLDFNEALQDAEKARLRTLFPDGGEVLLNFY